MKRQSNFSTGSQAHTILVSEIRAAMASAKMNASQLTIEEDRRKEEFEKKLVLKQKMEKAQNEEERIKLEAQEKRKTQQG